MKEVQKQLSNLVSKLEECGFVVSSRYLEMRDEDSRAEIHFKSNKGVEDFSRYILGKAPYYEKTGVSINSSSDEYKLVVIPLEHRERHEIMNAALIKMVRDIGEYFYKHKPQKHGKGSR